ncbi:hypothetical protein F5X97DRAFT_245165 [Nemania serpens]|nr:hypothetical protein F5X97DRAFT_245165 [Nemania serpens]
MENFQALPSELRFRIWEAILHLYPIVWTVWFEYFESETFVDVQLVAQWSEQPYLWRMRNIDTLWRVSREARDFVCHKFWFAPEFSRMLCPVDPTLDLFALNQPADCIDVLNGNGERYENADFGNGMGICIRNVYIGLDRLKDFVDGLASGALLLPALTKIYVKSHVAYRTRVSLSPNSIPTVPAISAIDESCNLQAIFDWEPYFHEDPAAAHEAPDNVHYISETDGFDRMDRASPAGWGPSRYINWPLLVRLGIVCVFVHWETGIDWESRITDRFYVFSTTHGPNIYPRQVPSGEFIDFERMSENYQGRDYLRNLPE